MSLLARCPVWPGRVVPREILGVDQVKVCVHAGLVEFVARVWSPAVRAPI